MGLFEYITEDFSERKTELNNQISKKIIDPILEKKFEIGANLNANTTLD